jgi:hypothetical protein
MLLTPLAKLPAISVPSLIDSEHFKEVITLCATAWDIKNNKGCVQVTSATLPLIRENNSFGVK